MKLSFICCIFNEIKFLPRNFDKMASYLSKQKIDHEIIIIDNFSTDGSREWLQNLQINNVKIILNRKNIGKGGSIKKGIEHATGELAIIFDLDGEYFIEDALVGVSIFKSNKVVLALGSRTLSGQKNYIYFLNFIGVKTITKLINFLYSVQLTDTATGLKILSTKFYLENKIWFNGFNVDFELVCLALNRGYLVPEFIAEYQPRSKKDGKKLKALKDGTYSFIAILVTFLRSKTPRASYKI